MDNISTLEIKNSLVHTSNDLTSVGFKNLATYSFAVIYGLEYLTNFNSNDLRIDPYKNKYLKLIERINKRNNKKLVEAMGIEPMSEKLQVSSTTCLAFRNTYIQS